MSYLSSLGFPDCSAGKESACNAGDPSSIHESRRSLGEGNGYLLQYSWASLVAQLVKNPPSTQETWVQSLDWADPLGKGKATNSSILAWRIPWTVVHGVTESRTVLSDFHLHFHFPGGSDGKESACSAGDPGSMQCGLQDTTGRTSLSIVSTLCDPIDCSPLASSDHGILQARITGVGCHSHLHRFSQTRDQIRVSCIAGRFFIV